MKNLKYDVFRTEWGFFGILADENRLIRTILPTKTAIAAQKHLLKGINTPAKAEKGLLPDLQKDVVSYYKGGRVNFNKTSRLKLNLDCSDFARKVLTACMKIKFGQTVSYGQLAEIAAAKNAARAVGTVLAKNQLPLIIPCHRIIKANGQPGQFSGSGGIATKSKMLNMEKICLTSK